jgi:hypothetical protein
MSAETLTKPGKQWHVQQKLPIGYGILTAVTRKSAISWDVIQRSLKEVC